MCRNKRSRWNWRSLIMWMAGLLVLCIVTGGVLCVNGKLAQWERQAEAYRTFAQQEKAWILSCQTEDGLILYRQWNLDEHQEEQTVFPYFSSIAALGLLSGTVTDEQAEGTLRYQQWYLDHLNTPADDPMNGQGTVYNYRIIRDGTNLREESLQTYDSVDSYAAMFLILVDRYAQVVNDELLLTRSADILRVLDALVNTIDRNGLSHAKAEYPVQYLMDNAEVYAGLCAATRILEQIGSPAQLEQIRAMALQVRETMDFLLWNAEGYYEIGIFEGEALDFDGWTIFYPDSVCQLFPLCFCVLEPESERAAQLYHQFCQAWNWERLEPLRREVSHFYWGLTGYAAALMQDEARLSVYKDQYQIAVTAQGRAYPLYTGEAGWLAMACGHMEQIYLEKQRNISIADVVADVLPGLKQ